MSRNLLHRTKLQDLIAWLTAEGIEHRPGRGDYQVLQVLTKKHSWQAIYERSPSKTWQRDHYTVTGPLEGTIRKFIGATRAKNKPES